MSAEAPGVRRVLVGFGSGSGDAELLSLAADLAAGFGAELAGVYVEDERLLRLAALPIASELGYTSARLRPLSTEDVERSLRIHAERMRRRVQHAAAAQALAWTLEVVRGEIVRSALALAADSDLLVVAGAGYGMPFLGGGDVRPTRSGGTCAPLALILSEASNAARRALALIAARPARADPLVLLVAKEEQAARNLREFAAAGLGRAGQGARYALVARGDPQSLGRALRDGGAAAIVLPRRGDDRETLAALRVQAPGPWILVA